MILQVHGIQSFSPSDQLNSIEDTRQRRGARHAKLAIRPTARDIGAAELHWAMRAEHGAIAATQVPPKPSAHARSPALCR
jgi:hypothetical protein